MTVNMKLSKKKQNMVENKNYTIEKKIIDRKGS